MAKKNETPDVAPEKKWADKAGRLFEAYPDAKELYFTSDGQAFFTKCDALNHAGTLEEKEIEKIEKQYVTKSKDTI